MDMGATRTSTASLTIRPEDEEEPAEGPATFDVFDDGGFVVADPLANRLVTYDPRGQFRTTIGIGVPASKVSIVNAQTFAIEVASSGEDITFSVSGRKMPQHTETRSLQSDSAPDVRLSGSHTGVISWADTRDINDTRSPTITVELGQTDQRLASLGIVDTHRSGDTFVALESGDSRGLNLESITLIVRRYDPNGNLVAQIPEIPNAYYVMPNTQFRVRQGVVYQLQPKRHEVLINVWDTN
jgi:hypothetical protein